VGRIARRMAATLQSRLKSASNRSQIPDPFSLFVDLRGR
jgi:hypothetical protein